MDKEALLKELLRIGYDNPKLSDLSEDALSQILRNNDAYYKRNTQI